MAPMTSPAPLTAERLAELRKRVECASDETPLPWRFRYDGHGYGWIETDEGSLIATDVASPFKDTDDLVAMLEALNALPALLADRERLEARAQAAEARIAVLEEALRYGFNLYGYEEADGPWPNARRSEFDRLARAALAARDTQEHAKDPHP